MRLMLTFDVGSDHRICIERYPDLIQEASFEVVMHVTENPQHDHKG